MLGTSPTYRPMMVIDIERSAGRGDVALGGNRSVLMSVLREAFIESQIDWDACHREDTGDGVKVVTGPDVPKTRLIHPLVHGLAVRLRAHNQTAGPLTTVRVRVGVHAGDVHISDGRIVGGSLEFLARLADAPPLRHALAVAPASVTVALAVSAHVYDEVVRHRYTGIDPETYHRVTFRVKETSSTAWLHLPGCVQLPIGPAAVQPSSDVTPVGGADASSPPAVPARVDSMNIAMGHAQVGEQIGRIGTRIDHVAGPVHLGTTSAHSDDLRGQVVELRRALEESRRAGLVDEGTFAEAEIELRVVDSHVAAGDPDSRGRLVRALKKLKALVEDVADLAAKISVVLAVARGR